MKLHDEDIVDIKGQVWNNGWDQVWLTHFEDRVSVKTYQLVQDKVMYPVRRQLISN
jgi:hypothetical protein